MMEGKQARIDIQLNNARREMIEKNRMKLRPIVSCIITCARQNVALRGHRDDAHHYIENNALNPGNFIMFLKYGAYCGNIMDLLFKDCPANKMYRSKTIQNDILEICGDMVKEVIVEEVKKAKFFTVLADEATDCSNIEQMALVLRFLDSSDKIGEDFLGFIACEDGLTGLALSQEITNFVGDQGLSMDDCHGQGYDGAGNMAGKLSGVAACIQGTHEKAIYVHCNSHILNLCVALCCSIPFVRDMMDNVRSISNFFNDSPKRTQILTRIIREVYPEERQVKLLNVCRTRWVARIDGLKIFRSCYLAILKAFKEVKKNSKFLVSLILVERCLKCTRPLTLQLQSASLDAGQAREKVSLLFLTINELRSDIENTHNTFYQMAVDLAKEVNVEPKKKRAPAVQVHGVNVPSDSISEYWKRAVTTPFLDQLLGQIQSCSSEGNLDILDAMSGMPNKVVADPSWKENFLRFLTRYKDDLPDFDFLECELRMWRLKWTNYTEPLPANLEELLPCIDELSFPNILTAMRIFWHHTSHDMYLRKININSSLT